MSNNNSIPGVNVREVTTGVPQIRGSAKNVGGFIGRALRGPAALPVRITSFPQFVRIFGSYDPNSNLAESVEAFFNNGGTTCYVCRVIGSAGGTSTKASLTLSNAAGGIATAGSLTSNVSSFPVGLTNGDTFIAEEDAGVAQAATIVAHQASITGAAATYAAGAGGTLVVSVKGVSGNQTITFTGAEASEEDYLEAINNQLRRGHAVNAGGQVKLVADWAGSASAGSIVSGTAYILTSLGLSAGAFTLAGGSNVADVDNVTAAELASIFNGAFTVPGSTSTANSNNSITCASNTTGASSKFQFTGGTGVSKIAGFDTNAHSGSAGGATSSVMTFSAVGPDYDSNNISVQISSQNAVLGLALTAALSAGAIASVVLSTFAINRLTVGDTISLTDSNTAVTIRGVVSVILGNTVVFASAPTASGALATATTMVTLETFTVSVLYEGAVINGPFSGLRLSSLSAQNYFVTVLGGVLTGSLGANALDPEYITTVTDLGASAMNVDLRPVNVSAAGDYLSGGTNYTTFADLDYIGQSVTNPYTGMHAMKAMKDQRMLAVPGITGTNGYVSQTLIQLCDSWGDRVAVITAPAGMSPSACAAYKQALGATSFGIFYYLWYKIISKLTGALKLSPPEGYIMGMFCRTDNAQGIAKAPAGDYTGQIKGVRDVEAVLSDDDYGLLYPLNINASFNVPDVGVCVEGSRTMEDGYYNQVSVRRTMIYLEQSLKTGSRFVIFEPNTASTRAKLSRASDTFLNGEWRKGTLDGTTQSAAYSIQCDDSNNPPNLVAAMKMREDIQVNIPLVTENLDINIMQTQAVAATVGQ